MKFELVKFNRNIPDKELLADVRRVAAELKQDFLTFNQYEELGKFNASTPKHRFGSWSKVLEKAGLPKIRKQLNARIENEELFHNLEEVWTKLGRQPRISEMFEPLSRYSSGVYKRRFGTWMKALENFVSYINKEEKVFSEEGIGNLAVKSANRHKTERSVNWRLRFLVMRQDNFKCRNCGNSPATDQKIVLNVDHIKAWANGGETILENLQTLCSKCNIGKSNL
ncbi:HNH endonuclease [Candidatus Woesearchaeota archaeon]|nr:HNH endonuclease [Candidatus Woesearchaeota archaeon]